MTDAFPVKIARSPAGAASSIHEFQVGDTVPVSRGGTGVTSLTLLGFALAGSDFDASSLNGVPVIGAPTADQVLLYNGGNWIPSSIQFPVGGGGGGSGVTSINSLTGPAIIIQGVSGLEASSGSNNIIIGSNYTSAIWNASGLNGIDLSGVPTDNQVLLYSTGNNAWIPSSIQFPGGGVTSINSQTGAAITFAASGGTILSAGLNQINVYSLGKFSSSIGDGVATSFTVTHNLGTQDFLVNVYSTASPYTQVRPTIKNASTTQATLEFTVAPTSNQYRVVIIG